ncbi:MAG: TonB-dependent receptor [Bryobacteraceae bacterium]
MKFHVWKLCALLLASTAISSAQTGLATITGTVTDPSGAVIANAPIAVRNLETGQRSTATSTQTGNFTVSQLSIGDYDLAVAVPGFKAYTHTRFHLAAGQTMREDVSLEVGQTSESVTVTAESSLLKTETTEVGQNVTLSQLNNLPILIVGGTNSGFRDPFSSARLVPGMRYAGGSNIASGAPAAVTTLVINGTPANTFNARLDGMTTTPTGPRLVGAQMQTQPSVDAIEEVAIETSNFAAEFGTAGGAMINMVTKSGTNAYHGSAYDYGTNEAMNAHQPYTGIRNVVKQHDWGFTFGGPVRIPKVYDGKNQTFFFLSYEQYRSKNINTSNSTTVPLPAYRTGDFSNLIRAENRLITTSSGNAVDALGRTIASGTIFDPNTQKTAANGTAYRDPFVGNLIPVSRFDPITVKILPLIPQPLGLNASRGQASNNYQGTYDSSRTSAIPSIKVDQNLGGKGRLSFYYQKTHTLVPRTPTGADAFAVPITGSVASASSGRTIRVNYDYTITPRLLLHLGAGWNDSDFALRADLNNYDAVKQLGLKGQTAARYFPRLVTAVNGNTAIGGSSSFGMSGFPTRSYERRPSAIVSASYVTGGHTIKVGADWRIEKFPNIIDANTNGTYTFGTNMTEQPSLQGITTNQGFDGFEFASFLLGGTSANSLNAPIALSNNKSQMALYVQDSWKVTRKLTLDYGLRWDYGTYAAEQYGRNGSIGLAIANPSASGRLGANQFEASCKCNFATNYPYAYGPRLGLAYQVDSKTVLRAGIGVVYNATSTASGSSSNSASSSALPTSSGQITGLFKDGMPASVVPEWPSFNPAVGQGVGSVISMPTLLDRNAGRPARLLQLSFGLQREINRNLVVDASYVGNRGVWWTANSLPTLNALSQGTLRAYGFNDFASVSEGQLLTRNVASLTTAQRSILAARGITGVPYSSFPTASQTVRQSLRDYPQYSTVPFGARAQNGISGAPLGTTSYDSFQLSVTQRFSHGVSFNVNYNFSKSLDLMSATDPYNRANGRNLGAFDLPHQIRFTVQYQVPDLRNSGMALVSNRVASQILSGWGLGAYLAYQSAGVVSRPSSNGTNPISNFLDYGPGSAQLKTDGKGNYMNPWSVDWTDYSGKHHTDPIDINCHCFDPAKTVLLNPAAWENIPNGQFAADQSTLRFYRGQRQPEENLNFSRNFRLAKEGRVTLNVRVEFTNIMNRTRLNASNGGAALVTTGNFASAPTRFTSGANNGLYSGGFGTMNVLSGTTGQRTGTFVGRITF